MKTQELKRMWINQPSTLQPLHSLNAVNVLAFAPVEDDEACKVYFLTGDIVSQMVPRGVLSAGWINSYKGAAI